MTVLNRKTEAFALPCAEMQCVETWGSLWFRKSLCECLQYTIYVVLILSDGGGGKAANVLAPSLWAPGWSRALELPEFWLLELL